jgi:hypothetical protein
MTEQPTIDEREIQAALQDVMTRLGGFDEATRLRIFRTAATFFQFNFSQPAVTTQPFVANGTREVAFSDRAELPPKDFLFQKSPQTDVDRVVCLAYYLTHFRDTRHFKTVDISLLNTEGAQVKFSNPAFAVANAANAGLVVPAGKGFKQLSALGERYVEALPDRDKAKEVLSSIRTRRSRKAAKKSRESVA